MPEYVSAFGSTTPCDSSTHACRPKTSRDRNSENTDPVSAKWLRTVADVLRDYHRQPEYKFLGGGWNEEGVLRRRHVFVDTIEDIGKESDGWEED